MIKHLSLKAYGKINLGLDVLRRREDGYHDVRMIMQTVGIFDRVDLVRKEEPGIEVETNLYYLPTNENNLVYKAAKLLMDEFQVQEGIQIRLRKFIPVGAKQKLVEAYDEVRRELSKTYPQKLVNECLISRFYYASPKAYADVQIGRASCRERV